MNKLTIEEWKEEYRKIYEQHSALERENNKLQDMVKMQTNYNIALRTELQRLRELVILNHIAEEMLKSGDLNENAELNCTKTEFKKLIKDLEKLK